MSKSTGITAHLNVHRMLSTLMDKESNQINESCDVPDDGRYQRRSRSNSIMSDDSYGSSITPNRSRTNSFSGGLAAPVTLGPNATSNGGATMNPNTSMANGANQRNRSRSRTNSMSFTLDELVNAYGTTGNARSRSQSVSSVASFGTRSRSNSYCFSIPIMLPEYPENQFMDSNTYEGRATNKKRYIPQRKQSISAVSTSTTSEEEDELRDLEIDRRLVKELNEGMSDGFESDDETNVKDHFKSFKGKKVLDHNTADHLYKSALSMKNIPKDKKALKRQLKSKKPTTKAKQMEQGFILDMDGNMDLNDLQKIALKIANDKKKQKGRPLPSPLHGSLGEASEKDSPYVGPSVLGSPAQFRDKSRLTELYPQHHPENYYANYHHQQRHRRHSFSDTVREQHSDHEGQQSESESSQSEKEESTDSEPEAEEPEIKRKVAKQQMRGNNNPYGARYHAYPNPTVKGGNPNVRKAPVQQQHQPMRQEQQISGNTNRFQSKFIEKSNTVHSRVTSEALSKEEKWEKTRKEAVARFKVKRKRRVWTPRILYAVRQKTALNKIRIDGRFVTKAEKAALAKSMAKGAKKTMATNKIIKQPKPRSKNKR